MGQPLSLFDEQMLDRACELAREAQMRGNLPIGAVITLDREIVAAGANSIFSPEGDPTRHAEIMAIRSVAPVLWRRAAEMTLYTTLEPCAMCFGALLLSGIGRVVYGAADEWAGGLQLERSLPRLLAELHSKITWDGPARSEECGALFRSAVEIVRLRAAPEAPSPNGSRT